jgi:Ca2+-binding EF-hand superfamily protein
LVKILIHSLYKRDAEDERHGIYSYVLRAAKVDGSVDSSGVSSIMRSVGQNPSEAEIAV